MIELLFNNQYDLYSANDNPIATEQNKGHTQTTLGHKILGLYLLSQSTVRGVLPYYYFKRQKSDSFAI